MTFHIYYREYHAVLHERLITIQNCQHIESSVEVSNNIDDLKSHVMRLLRINQQSHTVVLEGVRPQVVPNSSVVVHILFEMRRNNAWALYSRKVVDENFDMGCT